MKLTEKEIIKIIEDRITIDAYSDEEVQAGWAIFLGDNITYPFEAEYYVRRKDKDNGWQKVNVIGNETDEQDFGGEAFYVEIELDGLIISEKILELQNIKADKETQLVIEVWKYEKGVWKE